MGLFSSDTLFTAKEMRGLRPQDSAAFRKLLSNKKIASILNQKPEQVAVWKKMKAEAAKTQDGRLTRDGMRRVLGSLRRGGESSIDIWKEAIPFAHEVLPGRFTNRYLPESSEAGIGSLPKSSSSLTPSGSASRPTSASSRFIPPKPVSGRVSPRF